MSHKHNKDYNYIIDNLSVLKQIPLTDDAIESVPKIDIHVHLPGTIAPQTAWQLGVRNSFIKVSGNKWKTGEVALAIENPHEHYIDIFKNSENITLNAQGIPENLEYNIIPHSFKSFDAVMATVQGHRNPPGGIKNESDLYFVLQAYLDHCLEHNIYYTEIQQNIKIAHQIYPDISPANARKKLYLLLQKVVKEYELKGLHVRFLHCFNKTQHASVKQSAKQRSLEAAKWLAAAQKIAEGVFVGIESAGHEKDESGWPIHLKDGYEAVKNLGMGCEAHGGEGIGHEHMLDVARTLPVNRIAHGFQVIENENAIAEIKKRDITLVMSPIINLTLGACITTKNNGKVVKEYITNISEHPFFNLLREHQMSIALCSDNPEMAGVQITKLFKILAGLVDEYKFADNLQPMTADELVSCLLTGIKVAFCDEQLKFSYIEKLALWCKNFILLNQIKKQTTYGLNFQEKHPPQVA